MRGLASLREYISRARPAAAERQVERILSAVQFSARRNAAAKAIFDKHEAEQAAARARLGDGAVARPRSGPRGVVSAEIGSRRRRRGATYAGREPMAAQQIRFEDGAAYERFMGAWSRLVGDIFLDWLMPPRGLRWIDIGCGSGAFSELLVERCAPAELLGIDPSEAQLASPE